MEKGNKEKNENEHLVHLVIKSCLGVWEIFMIVTELLKVKVVEFLFFFFRPHLLSLDLSFNNLSDLYDTINVLKTLPKLKNLVLQGNPLAVSSGVPLFFS